MLVGVDNVAAVAVHLMASAAVTGASLDGGQQLVEA
jgi:hypothetical protein